MVVDFMGVLLWVCNRLEDISIGKVGKPSGPCLVSLISAISGGETLNSCLSATKPESKLVKEELLF